MTRNWRRLWPVVTAFLLAIALGGLAGTLLEPSNASEPAASEKAVQTKRKTPQPPLTVQEKQTLAGQNNTPIARVNGRVIPHWMFDNALRDRLGDKQVSPRERQNARKEILTNLIDMELLAAEARRLGRTVGRGGGLLRLAIVERSYTSPEAFNASLAKAGMTRGQYADLWCQQAMVNRLVQETIEAKVTVSEEEIRQAYEEEKDRFQRPDGPAPLDEVRGQLAEALRKAKAKVALEKRLAGLKARARLEIFED
jgi:hypothetical protein